MLHSRKLPSRLKKMLKGEIQADQLKAMDELRECGDVDCFKEISMMMRDKSKQIRLSAMETLVANCKEAAIQPVLTVLQDSEEKLAHRAAELLQEYEPAPEIISSLMELLSDPDKSTFVQARAQKTLASYGNEVIDHLLISLLGDDLELKKRCVETLGMMGRPRAVEAIAHQLEMQDRGLRMVAVEALGNFGHMGVNYLLEVLEENSVPMKRRAVQALGKIGSTDAVPYLIPLLKHKDVYIRGYAARSLGQIGDPVAVKALVDSLYDCNWDCSEALVKIGKPATEELLKGLYFDKTGVRTRAANALREIAGEELIPHLVKALESDSWGVRNTAVESLAHFDTEEAWYALKKCLDDEYWNVRKTAVQAISGFEKEEVKLLLERMQDDPDEIVSRCAQDALKERGINN
jgi:HEAT repeat protein